MTFVWAYDTVAILDLEDYYDSERGILPAGQMIRFSADAEQPGHILCDLDNPRTIEKLTLPKGRVMRFGPSCFGWLGWRATRLQAVVAVADYDRYTVKIKRPSWPQRFIRYVRSHVGA